MLRRAKSARTLKDECRCLLDENHGALVVPHFVTSSSARGEDCFLLNAIELVYTPKEGQTLKEDNVNRLCFPFNHLSQENEAPILEEKKRSLFGRRRTGKAREMLLVKSATDQASGRSVASYDMEPNLKLSILGVTSPSKLSDDGQVRAGHGSETTHSLSHSCHSSDDTNDVHATFQFLNEVHLADTFEMDATIRDQHQPQQPAIANFKFQPPRDTDEFYRDVHFEDIIQPALSDLTGDDDDEELLMRQGPAANTHDVECRLNGRAQQMSELRNSQPCKNIYSVGGLDWITFDSTLSGKGDPFLPVEFVQLSSHAPTNDMLDDDISCH